MMPLATKAIRIMKEAAKMDIRMITTDLDGTLLNNAKEISPFTRTVLASCEQRGIPVVLSSGRLFEDVRLIAGMAGLHSPIISSNGARVDEGPFGHAILEDVLPLDMARKVFSVLKRSGLYIECYCQNTIYSANLELSPFLAAGETPARERTLRDDDGFERHFIDSVERMEAEGLSRAYKLAAFSREPDRLASIRSELAGLDVTINSAFPHNIEIMERGKGKGRAVRFLCERLGISTSQVMAFGDGTNDLGMLLASGVPVAMENAVDELKSVARLIAPGNDNDGVAQTIETYVLNPITA